MHVRIEEAELPMDATDDVKSSSGSGVTASAMAASYNDQIRPLLDAVDRLRHLRVS